ncbi:hypothetical protein I8748_24150 [Nostoc sp. CENA67]|uniref:Uncharacterized protein n=1 Tax=Amazonocrinis nigriterrae CENA67 TaxID=2794033 RepID=A0A8J7HTH3_9NOST|nr:hypothetical protein [Amazonocrinis nigriterrae]MBH8565237.1 hypothetical protein [Amazonocrinis nigriterrae CENA67]
MKLYCLQIIDNGVTNISKDYQRSGQGTNQAQDLARQLKGKFRRYPHYPQGTICELTWPMTSNWWQRFSDMQAIRNFYKKLFIH